MRNALFEEKKTPRRREDASFVTGATGFIGSQLVPLLVQAGHHVTGLTRSESSGTAMKALGGEPVSGTVQDLDGLRRHVRKADGVIHLAFDSDIRNFQNSSKDDREAVVAMGGELVGTEKPFVVSSVIAAAQLDQTGLISEESSLAPWNPRTPTEEAVRALRDRV